MVISKDTHESPKRINCKIPFFYDAGVIGSPSLRKKES
jgi:hypothetical protein